MSEILSSPIGKLVLWMALASCLVAVAFYVIGKIRSESVQRELSVGEMMSKFRESHSQGDLSDEEFRTIKSTLTPRLREELKDNNKRG